MEISEVIKKLHEIQEKHGDLDVYIEQDDGFYSFEAFSLNVSNKILYIE